jgi:hypothetical protein
MGNLQRDMGKGAGWYYFAFNSTELPKFGSYTFILRANKANYINKSIEIYVNILQIKTLINGTIFYPQNLAINVTTSEEFYFSYTNENLIPITDADESWWELQNRANLSDVLTGTMVNTSSPGIYKLEGLDTSNLQVGTYSIIIRISKENYIERQSAISLTITPIPVRIVGIESIFSESKPNNLTISFTLIDSVSDQPLINQRVWIHYNDSSYQLLENGSTGQYYWIIETMKYNVLAVSETFEASITIELNQNYTVKDIRFTVQVRPREILGIPILYWIIALTVSVLAVGIYVTARVVSYSKIPLVVKQIDATAKQIKKDKKFRNVKLTEDRNELIELHSVSKYSPIGFSLKGKLSGKKKIKIATEHEIKLDETQKND